MMNDAGKVLLKPKGRYDSLTTYEILDCVTYNGNAYVAKKTTVGNLPTEDGEYWCILIENVEITPTFTIAQNLEELKSGEQYQITFGKIAKAVKDYILHKVVKATNTQLGHVKVTNSAAVTDSTGLALAATEKNASIEGTLANLISQQNSNLSFNNFPGGTILEYYQKNPKIRGCFCIRPNIPTDLPAIFSETEGYLQFFRDTIGQRVLVVYWNYGSYNIIMRGFYANRWLHDWKMISTNNITN